MRAYIGRHEVLTPEDMAELALGVGTDAELWLGTENETFDERTARMDAALDILRTDPELAAAVAVVMAAALEAPDTLGGCGASTPGAGPCDGPTALRLVTPAGRELLGCVAHTADHLTAEQGVRVHPLPGHDDAATAVWHRVHLHGADAWMTATDDDIPQTTAGGAL